MNTCIAIYLKAPSQGDKALIYPKVISSSGLAEEVDFQDSAKELESTDTYEFSIANVKGITAIHIVAGPWTGGGCRMPPHFLLGDRGDTFSTNLGLKYDVTNRVPCTLLKCTFNGKGILTGDDGLGSTFAIDLSRDADSCAYLTASQGKVNNTYAAKLEFTGAKFPALQVP